MRTTYIYIAGDSEPRPWGLSGRARLLRMFGAKPLQEVIIVEDLERIPDQAPVLLVKGNYLFDQRVLVALAGAGGDQAPLPCQADAGEKGALALAGADGGLAALRCTRTEEFPALLEAFSGQGGELPATVQHLAPADLQLGLQAKLKKNDPPYVLPIKKANQGHLERVLFGGSYKSGTDLVTKWLWPRPAFWAIRFCVWLGARPNHVTALGLLLAVLAGIAFWNGDFGPGLLAAWVMTFLDTVDGKLARVTVTSTRFGDVFDHGIDLIHPPLWYLAWGVGLNGTPAEIAALPVWLWLMLAGYVGGRLCEGAFHLWAAPFTVFMWRPFDSFNRLITARRNPNLILLTAGWLLGRPDTALLAVVAWHLVSTAVLATRVGYGCLERRLRGPLRSWLEMVDLADRDKLAVRIFTRQPVGDVGEPV